MSEAGKTSVVRLPRSWFVVCESKQLKGAPLATALQGVPLVLFRDGAGKPSALLDRCPHRNVPLSEGRVVAGKLECRYHGWQFDPGGECAFIPGLVADTFALPSRCADSHACLEQDGFVWVFSGAREVPPAPPPRFPLQNDARYSSIHASFTVESTLHAAIENTLDVPHTAFLHGGLFRTAEKKNLLEVVVRRFEDRAEAQFIGEPVPKGLLGWLLAPQGGVVEHTDRFLRPCLAQVEYRLGEKSHLVTTSAFTPLDAFSTRVFSVVTFRLPVPHWLVKPFVAPVALQVFKQDAQILKSQTLAAKRFGGERYTSTELDVLGHEVLRLLEREAAGASAEPFKPAEHRLQMRT